MGSTCVPLRLGNFSYYYVRKDFSVPRFMQMTWRGCTSRSQLTHSFETAWFQLLIL
jgi:hypothetical protein